MIYLYNGYCYGETKVIDTLHLKRNQESQSSRFIKDYQKVVPPGCRYASTVAMQHTLASLLEKAPIERFAGNLSYGAVHSPCA